MANKLKELFLRNDTHFVNFVFKNKHYQDEFYQKIKELYSDLDTECVDISGIDCINFRQPTTVGEYQNSHDHVTDTRIFLHNEKIQSTIHIADEVYKIDLLKINKLHGFILHTLPDFPVYFHLAFNTISKQVKIKYEINYSLCNNASEWIRYLSIVISLFLYFTNPEKNDLPEEISSILINLYGIKGFFERIQKLESAFNTHFSTINLTDSENDTLNIELLYQSIVKGIPIKENISYTDISSPVESSVSLPNIGTKQLLQYDQVETIIIDKQEFSLYTKQFFFNAVVNAIEKEDETNNKIVFTGTDEKPLYSVKKYYLSSSDAPKLTGDITEYVLPIMNAKTLSEILSDLEKQERTEVEELLKKGRKNIKLKFDKIECIPEDNSNQ